MVEVQEATHANKRPPTRSNADSTGITGDEMCETFVFDAKHVPDTIEVNHPNTGS